MRPLHAQLALKIGEPWKKRKRAERKNGSVDTEGENGGRRTGKWEYRWEGVGGEIRIDERKGKGKTWECKEEMGMNISYIDVSVEEGKGIKVNRENGNG